MSQWGSYEASPRALRHLRRHPAAPCVAHKAHSHKRFVSRVPTPPTRRRCTTAPACHLHTTAQFPQRASSPWHTHSAHRRTLHTNGHRTPHEPPQFTWPRRRPRAAPALPPTATLLAWHHSQCTFARPGPLPTATQHDPRAQHATAAHHTIQHHQPGEPTPPNSPTSPTSPNSPTFQTSPQPSRRL